MDDQFTIYIEKMHKTHDNLMDELATIRAGRANPHVLDRITVDYYGTPTPIQQVGNVSVPEPRMIQIQPWEASMVKEIEKAILTTALNAFIACFLISSEISFGKSAGICVRDAWLLYFESKL